MSFDITPQDGQEKEQGVHESKPPTEAPVMLIVGATEAQISRLREAGEQAGFLVEAVKELSALPPRLELDPELLVLTSDQADACGGEVLPDSYRSRAVLMVGDEDQDGWSQLSALGICSGVSASASVAELAYRLPALHTQIQHQVRARLGLPMSDASGGLWDLIPATDWVTGLANRLQFLQELEKHVSRARRYKRPFCCLLVRFDNYEQIRQSEQGDERANSVLEEVAGLLEVSIREADFLARMHRDLFGLLLPETDLENAQVVIARIRQNLQQFEFSQSSLSLPASPSFSCGMSSFDVETSSADSLLSEAEKAVEDAKNS